MTQAYLPFCSEKDGKVKRSAVADPEKLWKSKMIPYEFDATFSKYQPYKTKTM